MLNRRQFLLEAPALAAAAGQSPPGIHQIDIIQHTHTDICFTDNPSAVSPGHTVAAGKVRLDDCGNQNVQESLNAAGTQHIRRFTSLDNGTNFIAFAGSVRYILGFGNWIYRERRQRLSPRT